MGWKRNFLPFINLEIEIILKKIVNARAYGACVGLLHLVSKLDLIL